MAEGKLLTPEEVAERLQISPLTARRGMFADILPGRNIERKYWRMTEEDLSTWIRAQPPSSVVAKEGRYEG